MKMIKLLLKKKTIIKKFGLKPFLIKKWFKTQILTFNES